MLQPPPGGLARLRRTIEARAQAAPTNRFVSPRLAVAASLALVAVIGVSLHPRDATHVAPVRAFDRQLRAAMAALPRPGQIVETGVVRELPSGRDDVRIIVAAPPIAIGAPPSP